MHFNHKNHFRTHGKLGNKILFVFSLSLFIFACNGGKKEANTIKKLKITVTTGMIASVVAEIVQEKASIKTLMGAGTDPHLYKATSQDMQDLKYADLVFYNGLHLEGKLNDILEKLGKNNPIFAVANALGERDIMYQDQSPDPHIWFDVQLWQKVASYIANTLGKIDKEHDAFYQNNAKKYVEKLTKLHLEVKEALAKIPQKSRVLVTAHDAFGYFGKAYQVEVRGLQGISTMSEYGLRDIADLTTFLVKRGVKAVFVESAVSSNSLEAVVKGCLQKGHRVKIGGTLYADALGAKNTEAGSYVGMVRENVRTITKALQ